MKVEVAVLCDAATDSAGKLNILGIFDCIFSRQVPAVHTQCAVALRIRFAKIEEGEHRIKINFVNEDGEAIMPSLDTTIRVNVGSGSESAAVNLILNIQQLKLDKFGEYSIDVAVDGREEASIPLFVKKITA